MSLYVGLISGTSMDGIDAALVELANNQLAVIDSLTYPYSNELRNELLAAIDPSYTGTLHKFAALDMNVGNAFANATHALLNSAEVSAASITAIGSHGQTLRHSPDSNPPYSLQIGNGPTIASQTRINTVNDFRGVDIASGGEGAPLVPAFHEWLFRKDDVSRVILNIGGIANVTILPANANVAISGFDTGPGNCLMDEWCLKHLGERYDRGGSWGKTGVLSETLLESLASDPYFSQSIPKSTGREYFSAAWLESHIDACSHNLASVDVQKSLLALTASSIGKHIIEHAPDSSEVLVCGGGVFNHALMELLQRNLPQSKVTTTAEYGIDPEIIEATSFAWFAHCRINNIPVKLTTRKTKSKLVLGAFHIAPSEN